MNFSLARGARARSSTSSPAGKPAPPRPRTSAALTSSSSASGETPRRARARRPDQSPGRVRTGSASRLATPARAPATRAPASTRSTAPGPASITSPSRTAGEEWQKPRQTVSASETEPSARRSPSSRPSPSRSASTCASPVAAKQAVPVQTRTWRSPRGAAGRRRRSRRRRPRPRAGRSARPRRAGRRRSSRRALDRLLQHLERGRRVRAWWRRISSTRFRDTAPKHPRPRGERLIRGGGSAADGGHRRAGWTKLARRRGAWLLRQTASWIHLLQLVVARPGAQRSAQVRLVQREDRRVGARCGQADAAAVAAERLADRVDEADFPVLVGEVVDARGRRAGRAARARAGAARGSRRGSPRRSAPAPVSTRGRRRAA